MKKIFILLFVGSLLQSCSPRYSITISSVESPTDPKQQFGDTKVVKYNANSFNNNYYEDDYIATLWNITAKELNFILKNKTGHTIKINWDDVSYVDVQGKTRRVMHSGVKYSERNNSQPATSIPRNACISDLLLPTDNVDYDSGKWETKKFFFFSKNIIGKKMYILLPIMIQNVQNDYLFEFEIGNKQK